MATNQPPKAKDTVRKRKHTQAASTQRFMPIAEIKEDIVVLKNGGLRAVLAVNAINFNLKSESEQEGIIAGYQAFVNTLMFPLQIVVRSDKLNIDPYIANLREIGGKQQNQLLKNQTLTYADFIEKLINVADIMQKKFYVIVPMDGAASPKKGMIEKFLEWLNVDDTRAKAAQRRRQFNQYAKELRDRVLVVQSGLENIGITMHQLTTPELVQLYYGIYNPLTSQKEKLKGMDQLHLDHTTL